MLDAFQGEKSWSIKSARYLKCNWMSQVVCFCFFVWLDSWSLIRGYWCIPLQIGISQFPSRYSRPQVPKHLQDKKHGCSLQTDVRMENLKDCCWAQIKWMKVKMTTTKLSRCALCHVFSFWLTLHGSCPSFWLRIPTWMTEPVHFSVSAVYKA